MCIIDTIKMWFTSRKQLIEKHKMLLNAYQDAVTLCNSIHSTIKYNILQNELLHAEYNIILGGICFQHGGSITVKKEFLDMMKTSKGLVINYHITEKENDLHLEVVTQPLAVPQTEVEDEGEADEQ